MLALSVEQVINLQTNTNHIKLFDDTLIYYILIF